LIKGEGVTKKEKAILGKAYEQAEIARLAKEEEERQRSAESGEMNKSSPGGSSAGKLKKSGTSTWGDSTDAGEEEDDTKVDPDALLPSKLEVGIGEMISDLNLRSILDQ
jgi:hypothetical protein